MSEKPGKLQEIREHRKAVREAKRNGGETRRRKLSPHLGRRAVGAVFLAAALTAGTALASKDTLPAEALKDGTEQTVARNLQAELDRRLDGAVIRSGSRIKDFRTELQASGSVLQPESVYSLSASQSTDMVAHGNTASVIYNPESVREPDTALASGHAIFLGDLSVTGGATLSTIVGTSANGAPIETDRQSVDGTFRVLNPVVEAGGTPESALRLVGGVGDETMVLSVPVATIQSGTIRVNGSEIQNSTAEGLIDALEPGLFIADRVGYTTTVVTDSEGNVDDYLTITNSPQIGFANTTNKSTTYTNLHSQFIKTS